MDVVARAKNIVISPKTEWPVIAAEPGDTASLYTGYIMILAAIGPIASLLAYAVNGMLSGGLMLAIVSYVLSLIIVYILAMIFGKLAPSFGGRDDMAQALKYAAYASTAGWLGGVFQLIPALGILSVLCSLYGIYLLYTGANPMMAVPQEKSVGYTAVAVVVVIVAFVVVGFIIGAIVGGALMI